MEAAAPRVATQRDITAEIARIAAGYRGGDTQPRLDYPPYRSSALRHPKSLPVQVNPEEIERWARASARVMSSRSTPTSPPDMLASRLGNASS
ncbi:protocatechuate 3,4-dioxygenase beta subunit family protein [Mycobacterium xenopi 4042]|uniref:Protocatechuate 3,4-dioxygenase beta subunit family protein n=1 Tax=Mycobacterium xenopi 4042 TaxID=1299334 RepID=X8CDH1_MYCXE|nr:protocatechuate 3,4-dioxygenase beta subunit family protein [Mycobacterium xenopi 4042]